MPLSLAARTPVCTAARAANTWRLTPARRKSWRSAARRPRRLAGDDREPGKMGVKGLHPVPVIDDYLASIAGPHAGLDYGAVSRCAHSIAFAGRNVDSGVESALPVEGIHTGAEGAG